MPWGLPRLSFWARDLLKSPTPASCSHFWPWPPSAALPRRGWNAPPAPICARSTTSGDVTRDASHPPRAAQFRLDLRSCRGMAGAIDCRDDSPEPPATSVTAPCRVGSMAVGDRGDLRGHSADHAPADGAVFSSRQRAGSGCQCSRRAAHRERSCRWVFSRSARASCGSRWDDFWDTSWRR